MSSNDARDGALSDDPIAWFLASYARAGDREDFDASRAALATSDADGVPAVRFILVKRVDRRGFTFFTNLESPKAKALAENPRAALVFHWSTLGEQVRVAGRVEAVSADESDAYFESRPRASQLAAWASQQSRPVESRAALDARYAEVEARFAGQETLERPPFWGGLRLAPDRFEFWQNREARLHDRWLFVREGEGWVRRRLQP